MRRVVAPASRRRCLLCSHGEKTQARLLRHKPSAFFCAPTRLRFAAKLREGIFSNTSSYFSFRTFQNFFLTSGAHTRKRQIASLRRIGSLLRGEIGSRSECANRPPQGNANRVRSEENVFRTGRPGMTGAPFLFSPPAMNSAYSKVRTVAFRRGGYSSPEALAAAPCSRAGQMDS